MTALILNVLRYSWQYFIMLGLGMYILFQRADIANCRADNTFNEMALSIMDKENMDEQQKALSAQRLSIKQYEVDNKAVEGLQKEEAPKECVAAIGYLVDKAEQF